MKKNRASLINALIWAVAILGNAIVLHWSGNEAIALAVLGGSAGASIMIVSDALREEKES